MLLQRDTELGLMSDVLRDARERAGSLVLITGVAGIGKSALLQALANSAAQQDLRVLRASAALMERDFAFGVVRQLFESALASAGDAVRERWLSGAAATAEAVFAPDYSPTDDRWKAEMTSGVLHALQSLAANMSADRPLLILVDDLQWADEASLRWIGYLVRRLERLRIVVVGTSRDGDPNGDRAPVLQLGDAAAHTLRPAPLSLSSARAIVREHLGESPEAEFVRSCHEYTGGNPMLLDAVLRTLASAGCRPVAAESDAVRSTRPIMLRERLIGYLRAQPETARKLVTAISVLGDRVDVELLAQLAGLDEIDCAEALRWLDRQGLVTTDGHPRLVHLMLQDAAEQSMTAEERERLHVQAATLLYSAGYSAEQVAAHLLSVSAPQEQWAIEALRQAASVALRRGTPEVAVRYLRRALLNAPVDGEDRARLLVDLALAERSFDLQASVQHLSQAVPLLDTARKRAEALVTIAPMALQKAPDRVVGLVRRVAEDLGDPVHLRGRERELALRLEARTQYGWDNDPRELTRAVERLRALCPDEYVGTAAGRELLAVLVHAAAISSRLPSGEVGRLANHVLEREPASPEHVHTTLPLLVCSSIAADSTTVVASWLEAVMQHAGPQQSSLTLSVIHTEQALFLIGAGRVPEAKFHALEALAHTGVDGHEPLKIAGATLASVAMEVRDEQLSEQVFSRYQSRTDDSSLSAALRMLRGIQAAERGELPLALEHLVDCGQQLERAGWRNPVLLPWRAWATMLHHRLGNRQSARDLAEEEFERATSWGAALAVGRGLRLRGMLAGDTESIPLLREAVSTLGGSANQLELARAHVALGRRLLAAGEHDAEEHLRQGQQLADLCGVRWLAARASSEKRASSPVSVPRPVLTPTERKVAELAARGETNQEIAEDLGVTRRAVEKHLTNSYRKLNTSGRSGLADALRSTDGAVSSWDPTSRVR